MRKSAAAASPDWNADQRDRKARCDAGQCVVANMHKRTDEALVAWAKAEGRFVRIDRKSKWGNVFEIPDDGERDEVVAKFASFYLPYKPRLLADMPGLGGKVLGCWCHPEQCHGHVIAEIANRKTTP